MEEKPNKCHILVLPIPLQGHINAMVKDWHQKQSANNKIKLNI